MNRLDGQRIVEVYDWRELRGYMDDDLYYKIIYEGVREADFVEILIRYCDKFKAITGQDFIIM